MIQIKPCCIFIRKTCRSLMRSTFGPGDNSSNNPYRVETFNLPSIKSQSETENEINILLASSHENSRLTELLSTAYQNFDLLNSNTIMTQSARKRKTDILVRDIVEIVSLLSEYEALKDCDPKRLCLAVSKHIEDKIYDANYNLGIQRFIVRSHVLSDHACKYLKINPFRDELN